MGSVRKRLSILAGLALAMVLAAPWSVRADMIKWRHGIVQSKADAGFIYMAKEKGFFARRGLDVEYINLRGDKDVTRALLAGELDSGEPSPGGPLQAMQGGADIRFIGSSMPGLPFALYVRKDINAWQDLKGKTFAVSSPGSTPDLIARAMLQRNGVDPDSIKIANAGGSVGRVQALAGGKVDATASSTQFIPMIDKLGIKVLGYTADILPEYPRFVIIARTGTLQQKHDAVVNFLAAYMEGLDYSLKHRDETLALAAKINDKTPDDPVLTHMYDEVKAKGYVSVTSEIPRKGISWLQDEMVRIGQLRQPLDLDKYIDESFRTEALKVAKISP